MFQMNPQRSPKYKTNLYGMKIKVMTYFGVEFARICFWTSSRLHKTVRWTHCGLYKNKPVQIHQNCGYQTIIILMLHKLCATINFLGVPFSNLCSGPAYLGWLFLVQLSVQKTPIFQTIILEIACDWLSR